MVALLFRSLEGVNHAALRGGTAANRRAQEWQSSHEFRLSRSLLFAGRAGGLRAVGPDERDFITGFRFHSVDEFEIRTSGRSFSPGSYGLVKETCFKCHSLPGVYSFNSFLEFRTRSLRDGDDRRPAALAEVSLSDALGSAVKWKEVRPNWTALRELLADRLPVGRWNVEFANGVKEVCEVGKDRTASVAEPLRTSSGKAEVKDGSVVIVYQDDRVERWTPVGKRMVVEHWYPGAQFPSGTPVLGIAEVVR